MSMETIQKTLDDYNKLMSQVNKSICKKYNEENIIVCSIGFKDTFLIGTYRKENKYLATNEHRYLITIDELENKMEELINNTVETLLKVNGTALVTDMKKYKKALRISVIKQLFLGADDSTKKEIMKRYGKELSDYEKE